MKRFQELSDKNMPASLRSRLFTLCMLATLSMFVFVLSACGTNPVPDPSSLETTPTASQSTPTTQAQATPTQANATPATTPTTSNTKGYPVKVYFSKKPDSETNFTVVKPVNRVSPNQSVATFAIQSLIAGPTQAEKDAGYYTELTGMLTDPLNTGECAGKDFVLTLDKKGTVTEKGTATLKFCYTLASPGIGADARIIAQIETTLKQFSNIKKVVILDRDNDCVGDASGLNLCLQR